MSEKIREENLGETREIVGKATKCEKCQEICAVRRGVGIPINCQQTLRLHVECAANNSKLKVFLWLWRTKSRREQQTCVSSYRIYLTATYPKFVSGFFAVFPSPRPRPTPVSCPAWAPLCDRAHQHLPQVRRIFFPEGSEKPETRGSGRRVGAKTQRKTKRKLLQLAPRSRGSKKVSARRSQYVPLAYHAFDRFATSTFRPETSTNAPEELHEIAAFLRRVRAPEEGCGQLGCVLDQPQLIVQLHHHVAGHACAPGACVCLSLKMALETTDPKDESRSIQPLRGLTTVIPNAFQSRILLFGNPAVDFGAAKVWPCKER